MRDLGWRVWFCFGMVALGAVLVVVDLGDGKLDEPYGRASGAIFGSWVPVVVIVLALVLGVREYRRARPSR